MSEESTKTPLDHVNQTVTQLKEMRHYSKNNVELLTAQWLKFDGEHLHCRDVHRLPRRIRASGQDMPSGGSWPEARAVR